MADPKKDIKQNIPTMSSRAYNTPEPRSAPTAKPKSPSPGAKPKSAPPAKPKAPRQKPKFVATPGTGFKDNSGTNNQPKTVTSGDRAKEALKKAVKTSVGISPFTAMDTVDPTTGQVLPTGMGQGPTNVGNANTAQTLQAQADAQAVKANRAGKPATTADVITQTPMTMQGNFKNSSISAAARMFGNVSNPVPSPSQNKGDLNKDGNMSSYETARSEAIQKSIKENK